MEIIGSLLLSPRDDLPQMKLKQKFKLQTLVCGIFFFHCKMFRACCLIPHMLVLLTDHKYFVSITKSILVTFRKEELMIVLGHF